MVPASSSAGPTPDSGGKMSGTWGFANGMISELGTSIGSNCLFVCYRAVTALMERFCQTAFVPRATLRLKDRFVHA
jgi:hypothetical protein